MTRGEANRIKSLLGWLKTPDASTELRERVEWEIDLMVTEPEPPKVRRVRLAVPTADYADDDVMRFRVIPVGAFCPAMYEPVEVVPWGEE